GQTENAIEVGTLNFGQTYFWRVDEVNGTPDKTVFKGEVWRFEVEPYSIPVPGSTIAVTASSSSNEMSTPDTTINGSGLGPNGVHGMTADTMWFTATVDLDPWIQYEFENAKKLDTMTVWNSNSAAESAIGWGVKDVEIAYSVDGENWDVLADANQFSRALGLPTYDQADTIAFNGAVAKYVRLNIQSNWGGILMAYGLSEVQFSMVPVRVRTPDPASGAVDILPNAIVTWRPGHEVDQHTIYVDTDESAVADGTAVSVSTRTNSLDLGTLDLQLGETYYWRVDEVNDAEETTVWAGPVWTLDVAPVLIVDDFERYENTS
ncbi:MAG: discoidin domain-containing protein, partial [Planctomycetes bacterium]|nr:discoidin domain-containing protein [Planctomycetota bacterium]